MTDKPPWIAHNKRERQAMIDWVNARLDEGGGWRGLSPEHAGRLTPESIAQSIRWINKWQREGGPQLELAQHGDIGPARELVRKVFPHLADLLQPPKLERGEKYLPYTIDGVIVPRDACHADVKDEVERKNRIAAAVTDVRRIQRIWQRPEPDGYGKRRRHSGPTAIEIAAARHGVENEEEVAERLKRSSPSK